MSEGHEAEDTRMKRKWLGRLFPKTARTVISVVAVVVVVLMTVPVSPVKAATWWDAQWVNRLVLSFNTNALTENLTYFVATAFFDSSRIDFSDIAVNGTDLRVVDKDDVTPLPYQITSWNGTAGSENFTIIFQVPQIDAYSDYSDYVYLYYNNPIAVDAQDKYAVWANTGAQAVYPLYSNTLSSNVTGASIFNSVSANHTGTATGTTWTNQGRVFYGDNVSRVTLSPNYGFANGITVWSWWSRAGTAGGDETHHAIVAGVGGTGNSRAMVRVSSDGTELNSYVSVGADGNTEVRSRGTLSADNFNSAGLWWSPVTNTRRNIVNGVLTGSTATAGVLNEGAINTEIGRANTAQFYSANGTIGEVRIFTRPLSSQELLYYHRSEQYFYTGEDSGFIHYGGENPQLAISTLAATGITMDKDGVTAATLGGNVTSLGSNPIVDRWAEYGLTGAYGSTTIEHVITINATDREYYGLAYPVTYVFSIPSTAANMTVAMRRSALDAWQYLPVRTSGDFFNGIDAVRFDYTEDLAYVSVGFGATSTTIYLEFYEDGVSERQGKLASFLRVAPYYDDREAVVIVTVDDLDSAGEFDSISENFSSRSIWLTGGGSSTWMDWAAMQAMVDNGYFEVASHSRTHPNNGAEYLAQGGYANQIEGSKQDITGNLTLSSPYVYDGTEYVPLWIEPSGYSDSNVRAQTGVSRYLISRNTWRDTYSLAVWDVTNSIYNRVATSSFLQSDNLTTLNSKFDTAYNDSGIYHTWFHPSSTNLTAGTDAAQHLDYIKEKNDVWYVGFGALYMYEYTKDRSTVTVVPEMRTLGTFQTVVSGLLPGQTYHYRVVGENAQGAVNGTDTSFTFTMPTVVTGSASVAGSTITLNGDITNTGVAADSYVYFEHGPTLGYGSTTTATALAGANPFADVPVAPSSDTTLFYRAVVQNGAAQAFGAGASVNTPSGAGGSILKSLLRVLLATVIVIGAVRIGSAGGGVAMLLSSIVGIIAFVIADSVITLLL